MGRAVVSICPHVGARGGAPFRHGRTATSYSPATGAGSVRASRGRAAVAAVRPETPAFHDADLLPRPALPRMPQLPEGCRSAAEAVQVRGRQRHRSVVRQRRARLRCGTRVGAYVSSLSLGGHRAAGPLLWALHFARPGEDAARHRRAVPVR